MDTYAGRWSLMLLALLLPGLSAADWTSAEAALDRAALMRDQARAVDAERVAGEAMRSARYHYFMARHACLRREFVTCEVAADRAHADAVYARIEAERVQAEQATAAVDMEVKRLNDQLAQQGG